jgi:hypothetical protein
MAPKKSSGKGKADAAVRALRGRLRGARSRPPAARVRATLNLPSRAPPRAPG